MEKDCEEIFHSLVCKCIALEMTQREELAEQGLKQFGDYALVIERRKKDGTSDFRVVDARKELSPDDAEQIAIENRSRWSQTS